MTSETNLVRECLLRASQLGNRLWRQQSGMGWIGQSTRLPNGDVLIKNARPFHAGHTGLADTGGYAIVDGVPIICQIEVKTPNGRVRPEQRQWISFIRSVGGLAGVARSAQDVDRVMRGEILD